MIKSKKNNAGFSMVEALVAALIFGIGVVGVFATMSSQKTPSVESDKRVQAAYMAKRVLDDLRAKVDATTWTTGNLALGGGGADRTYGPFSLDGGLYNYTYTVSAAGNARKVDLNITY